jgi:predicted DNA-binding protein YlxM (UPF0122 family)
MEINMDYETYLAINDVLSYDNVLGAFYEFKQNSEILKKCRFIFFSDEVGSNIPYFLRNNKIENFSIHSLVSKNKMVVLDEITYNEMEKYGSANYLIDTCIALDTQTVSYLKNIFTSDAKDIPDNLKSCIEYLIRNNINYDYSLYAIENAAKLNSQVIETYENILACERFKCLDVDTYLNSGVISYTKTENELKMDADDVFYMMNKVNNDENLKEGMLMKCNSIKALLLKTICIQFLYPKKGLKFKITMLIDFINNELGYIGEREIALCYLYFSHDKRIQRFFKKIQPNNLKDILKDILGMAWDLTHLRHLEYLMANMQPLNARYELYSIITFDYGLQEVLETFPIKRCALYNGIFMPIFEVSLFELIKEVDNLQEVFEKNKIKRHSVFKNVNFKKLVDKLENELINIMTNTGKK